MELKTYHDYIQLNKEIDQIYHEAAVWLGFSDSVMALLFSLLEEGDGLTPTELYHEWSLSKQTGHSALAWLEKRGFVTLKPGEEDRRSKGVFLTDRGRVYAEQAIGDLMEAERRAFAALEQEEQRQLVFLTEKIVYHLKKEVARVPRPERTV